MAAYPKGVLKMRKLFIVLAMLLLPLSAVRAEVNVGIGFRAPGISVGINMPAYPRLVRVPGYPVYYDPQVEFNFFFYDGMYWVYHGNDWYASSWYNGPWYVVEPDYVPLYVLRVPVRYYRNPPSYFRGWHADAPPHWGEYWGDKWEQRHNGWDRWDRHSAPRPAPLPTYQRKYSGERYPREFEQQHTIRSERYRYQPREQVTKQYYQQNHNPSGQQYKGRERQDLDRSRGR
jgi:hypothetical protein